MDDLNDIKKIWLSADVNTLPSSNEVIRTIKRYRLLQSAKNAALIFVTLILMALMVWVVFVYKSSMLVTRIGEACFFIAMLIIIGINAGALRRVSAQKNCNNEEFITFLKQEQDRQMQLFKRTQVIGFVIAGIGLLLYCFEFSYKTHDWLIAYLPVTIWLLVCWFIIRPISIKRKTGKLKATIEKLERLSHQLLNN